MECYPSFQATWKPLEKDPVVPTLVIQASLMEQGWDVHMEACQAQVQEQINCCCFNSEGF